MFPDAAARLATAADDFDRRALPRRRRHRRAVADDVRPRARAALGDARPTTSTPSAVMLVTDTELRSAGATRPAPSPPPARSPLRRAAPWLDPRRRRDRRRDDRRAADPAPTRSDPPPLSASNAEPDGAMAVAEVLRQQGVDVIETTSLADTEHARATRAATTTILLVDPDLILDESQHDRLLSAAARVVVVEPYRHRARGPRARASPRRARSTAATTRTATSTPCRRPEPSRHRPPPTGSRAASEGIACLTVAGDLSALVEVRHGAARSSRCSAPAAALRNDQVADRRQRGPRPQPARPDRDADLVLPRARTTCTRTPT